MNIHYQHLNIDRLLTKPCLIKHNSSSLKNCLQSGFTLLEIVLVLFLIGLMASATLMLTDNVEDQAKYDATKQRMEIMRKAIVGDPTRTVNGGPEISGFVADMGRLPLCVAELLTAGEETTSPPESSPKTYESPCHEDTEITAWTHDASTGISYGWRGPYISVLPERDGELRFRDGYGNSDADDALNSGWTWQLFNNIDAPLVLPIPVTDPLDPLTVPVSIRVQSKGFDDASLYPKGIIDDEDHDKRPVPLIVSADWQVQLPTVVDVTFKSQNSATPKPDNDVNLVLRIYLHDLNTPEDIEGGDGTNGYLTFVAPSASSAIPSLPNTQRFILDSSPLIAIGNRAYSIVCHDPLADSEDYVIFDGDCDVGNLPPTTKSIRVFSVVPRQSLNLTLDWIIQ